MFRCDWSLFSESRELFYLVKQSETRARFTIGKRTLEESSITDPSTQRHNETHCGAEQQRPATRSHNEKKDFFLLFAVVALGRSSTTHTRRTLPCTHAHGHVRLSADQTCSGALTFSTFNLRGEFKRSLGPKFNYDEICKKKLTNYRRS